MLRSMISKAASALPTLRASQARAIMRARSSIALHSTDHESPPLLLLKDLAKSLGTPLAIGLQSPALSPQPFVDLAQGAALQSIEAPKLVIDRDKPGRAQFL